MRGRAWLCITAMVAVALSGCGNSSNTANTATTTGSTAAAGSEAGKGGYKWSAGRQLIQDMRWGSETEPEKELLANVREAESTPDQRLVLALNDLGGWYRGQKRFDEAEKTYKRVLDLQKDRLGGHFDVVYSENDLAVVLTDAGKYPEAEEHFKVCLDTGEKMQSEGWFATVRNDSYAEWQHNYAVLLRKMGKTEEADRMEAAAVKMMADREKAIEENGKRLEAEADAINKKESEGTGSEEAKPAETATGDATATGATQSTSDSPAANENQQEESQSSEESSSPEKQDSQ